MNLAEMMEAAKQLSDAELEELALHIAFLRQNGDPAWREEVLRRAREARLGKGLHSQEDVDALHQRLIPEGR